MLRVLPDQASGALLQNIGKTAFTNTSDSGIGLDRQSLERIFDAFYTTKPEGLGMGLSISRSIVENHAGRLSVVAHDGPGTTFQFALPTYH